MVRDLETAIEILKTAIETDKVDMFIQLNTVSDNGYTIVYYGHELMFCNKYKVESALIYAMKIISLNDISKIPTIYGRSIIVPNKVESGLFYYGIGSLPDGFDGDYEKYVMLEELSK